MPPLRGAIVGAGLMGGWHARYASRAGGRVVAVVDSDEAAGSSLVRRYPGARRFRDLADCLSAGEVDVVHVCTGAASHARLAETALMAGRHVIVEKPLTTSPAEAFRLSALARERGLLLCAVHQFPFQRGFGVLRRDLVRLGDLVSVSYEACSAGGEGRSDEARQAILIEMLPHAVSMFRSLLGTVPDPASWTALAFTKDDIELAGKRGATLLAVRISLRGRPPRNELIVVGTKGTARVDLFHGYLTQEADGTSRLDKALRPLRHASAQLLAAGLNLAGRAARRELAYPGLRELIGAFYGSVRTQGRSPVGVEEMVEAAALMERFLSPT